MREELRQAVALFYDGNDAPHVTAKGEGEQAEEIIRIARENNVPLCDNPALVSVLSKIELDEEVPKELYVAVAHVIAFAYRLKVDNAPNPLAL